MRILKLKMIKRTKRLKILNRLFLKRESEHLSKIKLIKMIIMSTSMKNSLKLLINSFFSFKITKRLKK